MTLLISYNLACKNDNPDFYKNADMIRLNSPWYTPKELEEILQDKQKPKFLDINISERTKPKIFSHKYEDLLSLAGKYDVDWVGISNVEDILFLSKIKETIRNNRVLLCAKIETLKGCENILEIMNHFDAIMVDVEDLAYEIGWEEAKGWQNKIYTLCEQKLKDYFILSGVIFEYKDWCYNEK